MEEFIRGLDGCFKERKTVKVEWKTGVKNFVAPLYFIIKLSSFVKINAFCVPPIITFWHECSTERIITPDIQGRLNKTPLYLMKIDENSYQHMRVDFKSCVNFFLLKILNKSTFQIAIPEIYHTLRFTSVCSEIQASCFSYKFKAYILIEGFGLFALFTCSRQFCFNPRIITISWIGDYVLFLKFRPLV